MPNTNRLSPTEIQTDLPIHHALEVCWHVIVEFGAANAVIGTQRRMVSGTTPTSFRKYGRHLTATLEDRGGVTAIVVASKPIEYGTFDFGAKKKLSAQLADAIENAIKTNRFPNYIGDSASYPRRESAPIPIASPTAPIAAPGGIVAAPVDNNTPRYGMIMPIKRGPRIFIYGLLGATCCGIAAPFAVWYGIAALKEYRTENPGDKWMVILGLLLGCLGIGFLILRLSISFGGIGS